MADEHQAMAHPARTARLMRAATYASVSVACVLIAAKFIAWVATDSVSLLATLVDSLLDAAASLVSLLAVRTALEPPDREHRFGHGKAEPLGSLAQAAFVGGSAIFLVIEATRRLLDPQPIGHTELGIWVMLGSVAVTLGLVSFQRYVVSRTNSLVIGADMLHYQMDVLVNVGVLGALLAQSQLGWTLADPLVGLAVAALILRGAWVIGKGALDVLMDREVSDEVRQRIREIVLAHPEVCDVHDIRTRSAGTTLFVQLHLELDGDLLLREAHRIADEVTDGLMGDFPHAEVLVHQDPAGEEGPHDAFD